MATTTMDRRLDPRQCVDRPCTLFCRRTLRYISARTRDVSDSGALLEITSARPLIEGDRVDLGVAWAPSPIVRQDSLVEAKVVRVIEAEGPHQVVGVQYARARARLAAVA